MGRVWPGAVAGTLRETSTMFRKEPNMGIIGWILLGLLAGAAAKAVLPGQQSGGIVVTTLLGVVGAVVGGGHQQMI